MRFTSAMIAGLFAVAYAQETATTPSENEAPATTTSIDPVQASILACLEACADGDVACEATCVPVPNPSEEMVSMNNECIGNCPQGNGTEAEIEAYRDCQAGCIASFFFTATGIPTAATDATATDSADDADTTGDSDSDSANGSNNGGDSNGGDSNGGDADSDESTDGSGAGIIGVSGAAFGLAAFIASFVAL